MVARWSARVAMWGKSAAGGLTQRGTRSVQGMQRRRGVRVLPLCGVCAGVLVFVRVVRGAVGGEREWVN